MKLMYAVVGGVVIVAGLSACDEKKAATPPAAAETAPVEEDAGPVYLRLNGALDPALMNALKAGENADGLLLGAGGTVQEVIAASKMPRCDFGMRFTTMNIGRPGLAPMRSLARLLSADAKRCLAANDVDGAAERAAAIFRMSRQLCDGSECTIDLMVACALTQLGTGLFGELAGKPISTTAKDELRAASQGGFARGGEAAANECRVFAEEIRTNPEAFKSWLPEIKAMSAQDREALAAAMGKFAEKVPGLWNGPDAEGQITSEIGKLPSAAKTMLEPMIKSRSTVREVEQKMMMARSGVR